MRQINEFTTGYPTAIGNSQSQEYQGVLGPIDAETVQGKDRFNLQTTEGAHRLNVFLKHFFRRSTVNPHYEIAQLRARLNHLGYDFPWENNQAVNPTQTFTLSKTEVFGTTPTTDLSKGFDRGSDLTTYRLTITSTPIDTGFKLDGHIDSNSSVTEETIFEEKKKMKRNNRISMVKNLIKNKKKS